MLTPEAAWHKIAAELNAPGFDPPIAEVARQDAVDHTLAESLGATVDMPPADVSAMDGYACSGEVAPGTILQVVGTAAAGAPPSFEVVPGVAARIMTGAVVPAGADRVLPVEQTDGGRERVVFHEAPAKGDHIRRRGEIIRRGAPLLTAGTLLTPGAVSLLASHGYATVPVRRPVRVAVLTTGDELVPPEMEPRPGQLRDSNSSFLLAAGRSMGLEFSFLGIAPDRLTALKQRIHRGLDEADVLLLSGGVSMGEFDFVEEVLAELRCHLLFNKVAIQPGKPLVTARSRRRGGWILGLPGNPASVMVTFWLFVRPLLRRLQGIADGFWHGALAAELSAPLAAAKGRDRFLPAEVAFRDGRVLAAPCAPQGSHDVAAYAHGTALVRIRPQAQPAAPGERCEVLPLGNWIGSPG